MLEYFKNSIPKRGGKYNIKWFFFIKKNNIFNIVNQVVDYKSFVQKIILTSVFVLGLKGSALALSASEITQLNKLDPQTRIEQRCDIEAMNQIGKIRKWHPDKVLAYAFSIPTMSNYTVKAKGAAFRSRGKWYRLSYSCKTQEDYLTIQSFEFKIGDIIPREDWNKHYLVP